jgi:hypothetical protein
MMQGNQRRAGHHKPRTYRESGTDPLKTDAYQALDVEAIRRVGTAYWGELAEFTYWCYDVLNPLIFRGSVPHPLFQFCQVMPYGRCIGLSHTSDLDRPVIDVFLSLWTRRRRPYVAVFGVVAHEMMHFDAAGRWRAAGQGRYRTSHDNDFWLSGVEAASPLLGVDLAAMKFPFERWPQQGWTTKKTEDIEEALAQRSFPER